MTIEFICSDPYEHEGRVSARPADLPDVRPVTWQQVLARDYRPWTTDRIVIDTSGQTPAQCAELVLEKLT